MNIELRDIIQLSIFIITIIGGIWKFSGVLNELKIELRLMREKLDNLHPRIEDHESRIRHLEFRIMDRKDKDNG